MIKGLEAGADYITKPYINEEVLARISTQVKISNGNHESMFTPVDSGILSNVSPEFARLWMNVEVSGSWQKPKLPTA